MFVGEVVKRGVIVMKVTLFVTCLVDMFETNVGKATVEVLERLGCEIEFQKHKFVVGDLLIIAAM